MTILINIIYYVFFLGLQALLLMGFLFITFSLIFKESNLSDRQKVLFGIFLFAISYIFLFYLYAQGILIG